MYENLINNIEYDEFLEKYSKSVIIEDRNQYKDVIDYIFTFCTVNKILISDPKLYTGHYDNIDYLVMYTDKFEETSKKLISELCNKFEKKLVLRGITLNEKYTIEFNLRRICYIINIQDNNISSIEVNINGKNMHILNPILELINLYSLLYSTQKSVEWPSILTHIKYLESNVEKYISPKIFTKLEKKIKLNHIYEYLYSYLQMSDHVITCIKNDDIKNNTFLHGPINIISCNSIDNDIASILRYLQKYVNIRLVYKKNNITVLHDPLIKSYDVYVFMKVNGKELKEHIITIYNSASYELIPYNKINDINFADPIVQIRFCYILLWNDDKVDKYLELIKYYKKKIDIYEEKKNYYGNFVDAEGYKKMINFAYGKIHKNTFYCFEV